MSETVNRRVAVGWLAGTVGGLVGFWMLTGWHGCRLRALPSYGPFRAASDRVQRAARETHLVLYSPAVFAHPDMKLPGLRVGAVRTEAEHWSDPAWVSLHGKEGLTSLQLAEAAAVRAHREAVAALEVWRKHFAEAGNTPSLEAEQAIAVVEAFVVAIEALLQPLEAHLLEVAAYEGKDPDGNWGRSRLPN